MSEQAPNQETKDTTLFNRRRVVAGLAAAGMTAGFGGLLIKEQQGSEPNRSGEIPTEASSPEDQSNTDNSSIEQSEYQEDLQLLPLGDAEHLRYTLESEAPTAYLELFQITTENAPTQSAIEARLADLIQNWASAGCNSVDIASYLSGQGQLADYQTEMASKYGVGAAAGLAGYEQLKAEDEAAIEDSHLFKTINKLHDTVLEWYMDAAREGSTEGLSFTVTPTGYENTAASDKGQYSMAISFEANLSNGKDEPTILHGLLAVNIQLMNPENQSAANVRIQAISLDEQETELFQ